MIEANNPDIDFAALDRRIEAELRQPETSVAPPLTPSANITSVYRGSSLLALKLRLRAIPVLGKFLVMLNRWQRKGKVVGRLLAMPYMGYAIRWLKSLALLHETRGRVETAVYEAGFVEQRLNVRLAVLRLEVGFLEQRMRAELDQRMKIELEENLQRLAVLRAEVVRGQKSIAENRAEILFQQRRLSNLMENGGLQVITGGQAAEIMHTHSDALDSYYAAFEASFRGSREEIKRRLEVYLDRVTSISSDLPVLDIGCGRGEWIELLGEHGVAAYGVDLNSVFVADARANNLDVREAEALAHLRGLADASLAGLTGFHIIEHLELDDLIRIIDEANRVLAPGGFILFETPNPENLIVGASTFWSDPTHRAPLRPSVSRFMVEYRGFIDAEVIYLHPEDARMRLSGADETSQRLNQLLYGPQDYAIWARKV